MMLVAIAWMYVVLMVALVEATSPHGSWLGALVTLVFWGLVPLAIVLYILATPARKRARQLREAATGHASADAPCDTSTRRADHGSQHAPGDAVAPVRKEP